MASGLKWVTGAFCVLGTAAVLAGEAIDYSRAAQEFERVATAAKDENAMPRLSDPKSAKLLASLSDTSLLDRKTYRIGDLDELMSICDETNKLTMSYTLFGSKNLDLHNADPKQLTSQLVPLMTRNAVRFQDELTPLMAFSLHCQAKSVPPLTEFVATLKSQQMNAARHQGLVQYREGIFKMCYGALQVSVDPAQKQPNRVRILRELADDAPQLASVLQPQARTQLIALIRTEQVKSSPLLDPHFKAIADAMGSTRCEALCALL
jgi:hypothetical protein